MDSSPSDFPLVTVCQGLPWGGGPKTQDFSQQPIPIVFLLVQVGRGKKLEHSQHLSYSSVRDWRGVCLYNLQGSGLRPVAPPTLGTSPLSGRNVGSEVHFEHRNQRENTFKRLPLNLPAICKGQCTWPYQPSSAMCHLRRGSPREETQLSPGCARIFQRLERNIPEEPLPLGSEPFSKEGGTNNLWGKAGCCSAHPNIRSGIVIKKCELSLNFGGRRINYHPTIRV